MSVVETELFEKIKGELQEDCYRFTDGELDELDNWLEQSIQCPSNDLHDLMMLIPEESADEWFEAIEAESERIVQQMKINMEGK